MGAGGEDRAADAEANRRDKQVKRAAWQVPLNMGVGVGMS